MKSSIQINQLYRLGLELRLDLVSLICFLMYGQKRWNVTYDNVSFQVDGSKKSVWNNSTIATLMNMCLITVVMQNKNPSARNSTIFSIQSESICIISLWYVQCPMCISTYVKCLNCTLSRVAKLE